MLTAETLEDEITLDVEDSFVLLLEEDKDEDELLIDVEDDLTLLEEVDDLTLLVLERIEDNELVEEVEDSFELLELETTTGLELEEMDVVVELTVVHGGRETVLLKSYKFNLLEPPQYSERLPLQSILHPANPFGARAPPLETESPQ